MSMWEMLFEQGKAAFARGEFGAAQQQLEAALGQVQEGTTEQVIVLNHLGTAQRALGQAEQAQATWEKALAACRQLLGDDHPEVGAIWHNLAGLYTQQGRLAEAEPAYNEALRIVCLAATEEPLKEAEYLTLVASFYAAFRAHGRAIDLLTRALAVRERVQGPNHLDVARALQSLADSRFAKGDTQEAQQLRQRALELVSQQLGPAHVQVAGLYLALGNGLRAQRRYSQAEQMYRKSLAIVEKTLGPTHPLAAEVWENLAYIRAAAGPRNEAEDFYVKVIDIYKAHFGEKHPKVAQAMCERARTSQYLYQHGRARELYEAAHALFEECLGAAHPYTLATADNLVEVLGSMRAFDEARALAQKTLKVRTDTYGAVHPTVAQGLSTLGMLEIHQKEYMKAVGLFEQALTIWDQFGTGPDIGRTTCAYNLGAALQGAVEFYRAEELYRRALQELDIDFASHPLRPMVLKNLAGLLRQTGRERGAAEMEEQAQAATARLTEPVDLATS